MATVTTQERTNILKLVAGMFNAAPGAAYLNEFTNAYVDLNKDLGALANALGQTGAFQAMYPSFLTADEFANKFLDTLGLKANTEAQDWVKAKVNAGENFASVAFQALLAIDASTSDDFKAAKDQLANKAIVAEYYSVEQNKSADDLGTLQNVVATVTNDPATVEAAKQGAAVATGQTFTLTKSVQALTGTSGNDTFIAGDEGGASTLNAGDQIDGGAGTDTLKLFNAAGALNTTNFALATISNVENVEATLSATAQTLDVSGNAGVTNVSLVNGFDGVVTLKLAQQAGLTGAINVAGAAAEFKFSDNAGTADTATLNLNNAVLGANGVKIAGVETLNVVATGTNVLGKLDADAAAKLVVTGAGNLNVTIGSTVTKTIDASAATGNLTINNAAAAAAVQSIKTGSGNDVYITKFGDTTAADKIDLGTGVNTLGFADATDLSTSTNVALLAGASNYQALLVTGGAFAFKADGDLISSAVTKYVADTTGAFTGTNIKAGTTLEVGDVALAASTVAMKLGEKVLNVALAGTKTAISDASAGITVTGATDINLASNGTPDQGANKLALTSDDNTTLTITGSQGLVLTTTAAAGTTGFTINGSAATGALDLTGTAAVDTIKGGAGADTLRANVATGADVLTGGAGADKFIFNSTDIDTTAGAVTATITDFVAGTDTLQFGFGAGSATNYVEATAAASSLTALLTAADAALTGAVKYYVGQVGSDVYVVTDNDANGYTDVVKLTGVALDGISFADITA